MKPLENITVLDFSQFLSAPSAALKLADLGANVIKIDVLTRVIYVGLYIFPIV